METKDEASTPKNYHSPRLTVYGSIREITRYISGGTGFMDGGPKNSDKTKGN